MTVHEMAEIAAAAYNVNGTDRAAIMIRIEAKGNMRMTSYGEPDALFFAYEVVSKAWKDYGEGMGDVCGITALYKPKE